MKVGVRFLTLFALTTSTLAEVDLLTQFLAKLPEMSEELKGDATTEELTACFKSINAYFNECVPQENDVFSNKDKRDTFCKAYTSDKCKKFYENAIAAMDGCDKLSNKLQASIKDDYLKDSANISDVSCSKDENNKYCPLAELQLFQGSTFFDFKMIKDTFPTMEQYEKAINETCNSKSCSEIAYKSFEYEASTKVEGAERNKEASIFDLADKLIETLKTEECKAKQSSSSGGEDKESADNTSDAKTITFDTILLFILSVFLFFYIKTE